MVAHRQWLIPSSSGRSAGAPYDERADLQENKLDSALLNAWGSMAPYFLSSVKQRRLERFVDDIEGNEKQLINVTDERLRQAADDLRPRFLSSSSEPIALAFALAREATRRHTGMRHFRVQLLGGGAM